MNNEKTIKICGKEVNVRYCLASETGFEVLAGKEVTVFLPTPTGKKDEKGKLIYAIPTFNTDDLIRLGISCIIAAYERTGKEPPIKVENILYDAAPDEVTNLISAVLELRHNWYNIPSIVKPETAEKEDDKKNA